MTKILTLTPEAARHAEANDEMMRDVMQQAYKSAYDETVTAVMDLVKGAARKIQIAQSLLVASHPAIIGYNFTINEGGFPHSLPRESLAMAVDGAFAMAEIFISRAEAELDAMKVLADSRLESIRSSVDDAYETPAPPADDVPGQDDSTSTATLRPQGTDGEVNDNLIRKPKFVRENADGNPL